MAYSSGQCPQCGAKLNVRASAIDPVRRCEACGFEFAVRKASFSPFGCLGNLFSLISVLVFILFCCGAVVIFIVAMNMDWSSPTVEESSPQPTAEAVPAEPPVTPQELPPEPSPEPAPVVSQEPSVDPKQPPVIDIRTWTDKTGKFSTEASFGGMAGGTVTLRKSDGATVKIPFDQLSKADQDWIEGRRKNSATKSRP
jgi:hypothetical protein